VPTVLIQLLPILAFLLLGLGIGTLIERAHFRRLTKREKELSYMLLTDTGSFPAGCGRESCELVIGEVVIAADFFKTFLANIRKLIGGDLRSYATLMERARREAIVRMQESARSIGANRVINVRLTSSNIGGIKRGRQGVKVEMFAYGTAIHVSETSKR
jgi:uncharacterized protein YbjQ (UPF0145 family)